MKKKKPIYLKRTKRRKFSSVLIRKEIFAVLGCSLICLIFLLFLSKDYQTERTTLAGNATSNITSKASQYLASSSGDLTAFERNQLQWLCTLNSETGSVISAIYDLTAGETVADSTRTAFLIVRDKNSEPTASASKIYTCDYDELDLWKEMDSYYALPRTIPNLKTIFANASWVEMESDCYYINEDGTFLPGAGFLYEDSDEVIATYDSTDTIIRTFDCTPQDLSSYTQISDGNADTTVFGAILIGYDESLSNTFCSFPYYPSAEAKTFFDKCLADIEANGTTYYNDYIDTYSGLRSDYATFIAANGHEYAVLTVMHFDLFEEFGFILYPLLVAAYVVALVFGFVSARISYAGLRARYAMEDYRKTLMNTMAHDLKSPLMSISGYAENLQMNPDHPKRETYLQGIHSGISYMNRTIEDILMLSKLEEHPRTLSKVSVDLGACVQTLLEKHEPFIRKRGITVHVSGSACVQGDATLLGEALDNLLVNALTHSPEESTVNIVLSNECFTISNPCKEDLTEKITELCSPFVTGDENRSDQKGSGLGLAIVKNIADLHSCNLELSSENQTFEARLLFPIRKK